jgi:hypothetical protein
MESYYYYLFSISILDMCCLHMLCIKVYRKTSVGEPHHDIKTGFDHENHRIWETMNEGPCTTK